DARPHRRQKYRLPTTVEPVGRSKAMRELREQVRRVAQHEAPVLIVGEPGTGREAFARFLHSLSARATGPFVETSASGLTAAGAEAELPRLLEEAAGGVLFIDEVDDM